MNNSEVILYTTADGTTALDTLERYDYQQLQIDKTTSKEQFRATYDNATRTARNASAIIPLWHLR